MFKALIASLSFIFLVNAPNAQERSDTAHPVLIYKSPAALKEFKRTEHCFVWLPFKEVNNISVK